MFIRLSEHMIDTHRREISRNGKTVHVEPQAFDLLIYLIQNNDHVASRDELFATVWGGRIMSDATLASRINAAGVVIGDNGERHRRPDLAGGVCSTRAPRPASLLIDCSRRA
jgi:DNA-binding winged helix-turn-helix (wHTH) protein